MNKIIFTASIFLSAIFGYCLGLQQGNDVNPEANISFDRNERTQYLEEMKILTAEN